MSARGLSSQQVRFIQHVVIVMAPWKLTLPATTSRYWRVMTAVCYKATWNDIQNKHEVNVLIFSRQPNLLQNTTATILWIIYLCAVYICKQTLKYNDKPYSEEWGVNTVPFTHNSGTQCSVGSAASWDTATFNYKNSHNTMRLLL